MSKFQEHHRDGDHVSLPSRPLTDLEREISQKLKSAFVAWSVDQNIPLPESVAVFRWKLQKSQGGATRVVQEVGPAIQECILREVRNEGLRRDANEDVRDVISKVNERVDHELKIVINEFRLTRRTVGRLMSADAETRRSQLITLGHRSLEFSLHQENSAIVLEALRPLLSAAKALGISDIDQQIQPALSEYREKTQFQAPVFWRTLDKVLRTPSLAADALAGLPQQTANEIICSSTREQYPHREQYRQLRATAWEAALPFVESVMQIFERSQTAFGVCVARLFYEMSAEPLPEDSLESAINRELRLVYG